MNRHSFWCSIDKEKVCDCGYAELLEARHLLLEFHRSDIKKNMWDDYPYCIYCENALTVFNEPTLWQTDHDADCLYVRLHTYLEKNNAL